MKHRNKQLPQIGLIFGVLIFGYGGFLLVGGELTAFSLIDLSDPRVFCDPLTSNSDLCTWQLFSLSSFVVGKDPNSNRGNGLANAYAEDFCTPPFEVKVFQNDDLIKTFLGNENSNSAVGTTVLSLSQSLDLFSPGIIEIEVGPTRDPFLDPFPQFGCKFVFSNGGLVKSESLDFTEFNAPLNTKLIMNVDIVEKVFQTSDAPGPGTFTGNFLYEVYSVDNSGLKTSPFISFEVPIICEEGFELIGGNCVLIDDECDPGFEHVGTVCVPIECQEGFELIPGTSTCTPIQCQEGTELIGNTCEPIICQPGTHLEGNQCVPDPLNCDINEVEMGGICVPISCEIGEEPISGICQPITCDTGFELIGNSCVPITCDTGFKLDGNNCVPIICQPGHHLVGNQCVIDDPLECPTGEVDNGSGCEPIQCQTGFTLVGDTCVAIQCQIGEILDGNDCKPIQCQTGFELNGNTCEPIQCQIGEILDGDTCIAIVCSPGFILEGNQCVVDPNPPPPDDDFSLSILNNPYLYVGTGLLLAIPSGLALRKF